MSDWQGALGYALVGSRVEVTRSEQPDVALLLGELATLGWDRGRITEHAQAVVEAAGVWPHPVPAELRQGCGLAQFAALLGSARHTLGLDSLVVAPPSRRSVLDPQEQRLMREAPPHHVG